ncbi:hypothetical protein BHE74_00035272 [Ensete ventricosum]|nr:hypothetical protein GW17_00026489 [Ensete ventricosum]RWW57899.1 hypothetical protein BHE74_00035272 [Ensete ventricosum]
MMLQEVLYGKLKLSNIIIPQLSPGTETNENNFLQVRRRIKQVPVAFYKVIPSSLFDNSEFPGWTFGNQPNDKQEVNAIQNKVTV